MSIKCRQGGAVEEPSKMHRGAVIIHIMFRESCYKLQRWASTRHSKGTGLWESIARWRSSRSRGRGGICDCCLHVLYVAGCYSICFVYNKIKDLYNKSVTYITSVIKENFSLGLGNTKFHEFLRLVLGYLIKNQNGVAPYGIFPTSKGETW